MQHDDVVAFDSLASMYMIQKQLHSPTKTALSLSLSFSFHSTLLMPFAAGLCSRTTTCMPSCHQTTLQLITKVH